jgi:signal transduction histidine kinase
LRTLVTAVAAVNTIIFVGLWFLALGLWRRRRDSAAGWLALAFAALALLVTLGRLAPQHPHGVAASVPQRIVIELLVLFPYLLYRFATTFAPPTRRLQQLVASLTIALSIWTFALPHVPAAGEPRPPVFVAYLVAFMVHWAVLSLVVTTRLWRAGHVQPGIAASRMRLLAVAAATLTIAIVLIAFEQTAHGDIALASGVFGCVSGIAFLLGLAPPTTLRGVWRIEEQARMQDVITSLLTLATTRDEIAERVLSPIVALLGAAAAAIVDGDGVVRASCGLDPGQEHALAAGETPEASVHTELVRAGAPGATIFVWTSPYAPFFGDEELRLLDRMAVFLAIAFDRVRLFEQEHDARVALERANEVMTNFISLAAHELRTPVTTIHGFVQTLNHLGDRLEPEQQDELRRALEQQTHRMAALVEQLLDLSRLDAEAVQVRPQEIELRRRLEDVVALAAGANLEHVELDVPDGLVAHLDPSILDHIVTNLVTNAFRYGRPPVRVQATRRNGTVVVAVEDSGPGVDAELEGTLFERFTRAGVARDRVAGTGLGLAIARAYAQAHCGELRYERAQPSGARFVVELPADPAATLAG